MYYPNEPDPRDPEMYAMRKNGATLVEIGEFYGMTRERVRQRLNKYEKRYGLPSSKVARFASVADKRVERAIEERATRADARRARSKNPVEIFALDADLVGKFLYELGDRVLYFHYNRYKTGYRKNFPSSNKPTEIQFCDRQQHVWSVHSWVIFQKTGRKTDRQHHCLHVDGDITNNMFENLQVLSNVEHGKIINKRWLDAGNRPFKAKVLSAEAKVAVKELYLSGTSVVDLAKQFDIGTSAIYRVLRGVDKRYRPGRTAACHISKYRGVYWVHSAQKWRVVVSYLGRRLYGGYFSDEEEAARVSDMLRKRLFGSFAELNFP